MLSAAPRIMLTTDAVGGVWRYCLELAAGLEARGVECLLVTMGPPPSLAQRAEAAATCELRVTDLPLDWLAETPAQIADAARALAGIAQEWRADSIHLHTPALVPGANWPTPVVAVAHSCVGTWWDAVRGGALPPDLAWRAALIGTGLRGADLALAPSAAFAGDLTARYGLDRPVRVVHNGRRYLEKSPHSPCGRGLGGGVARGCPDARARLSNRAGLTPPPNALPPPPNPLPQGEGGLLLAGALDTTPRTGALTAGRLWDDGKNIRVLDAAAARCAIAIRAAGPTAGPNGTAIAFRNLHLLGNLDDAALAHEYAHAAAFVSVARYEPFGLAVLEAALAGCSLVLSDIPTFRELWDGAAIFVDPDDADAIARAIATAACDPACLSEAARGRARAYSAEAMATATLDVHRALLAVAAL
jgi:glycosyltransferase involved in cell wall biosynthesis